MTNPFPAPRAPQRGSATYEECLERAKQLVTRETGRFALGPIDDGDRLVIVTVADQHEHVEEAVTHAATVAGADDVRFLYSSELLAQPPEPTSVENGWKEAEMFVDGAASGAPETSDLATGKNTVDPLHAFLNEHPQYNKLFWDIGAKSQKFAVLREKRELFQGNWVFNTVEEFLSPAYVYPEEIVRIAERRIIELLGRVSRVRITDPEGTDLSFTLSREEAECYKRCAWCAGHLYLDPLQATCAGECLSAGNCSQDAEPVFSGISGVLAGTANHRGFFPRIELRFENGRLVGVEGGGKYGEIIDELRAQHDDIHWPGYPEEGFFWFCDAALCTLPKAFRRTSDMFESYWQFPNFSETFRAGIMHMGIGSRRHQVEEHLTYARENDLPLGHIHVHNYFPTFEVKLRDTGDWHKIVDRGRLTVLDSPEIRSIATKYGDVEELLRYDWVPPLAGINNEGNYMNDYAPDPVRYLRGRMADGKPI